MKEEIFYSLNTEDIQTVAREILNRELSSTELNQVKELVPPKINWYDAIELVIVEKLGQEIT